MYLSAAGRLQSVCCTWFSLKGNATLDVFRLRSHDDESKLAHVEEEDLPVESPAAAHITSPKPPVIEAREPGSSTTITPSRLRFSLERDSQAAALSHPALGAKRPTVLQAVQSFGSLDTESPRSPETVPDDADYTRVIKSVHTNVFMNEILQVLPSWFGCLNKHHCVLSDLMIPPCRPTT